MHEGGAEDLPAHSLGAVAEICDDEESDEDFGVARTTSNRWEEQGETISNQSCPDRQLMNGRCPAGAAFLDVLSLHINESTALPL